MVSCFYGEYQAFTFDHLFLCHTVAFKGITVYNYSFEGAMQVLEITNAVSSLQHPQLNTRQTHINQLYF